MERGLLESAAEVVMPLGAALAIVTLAFASCAGPTQAPISPPGGSGGNGSATPPATPAPPPPAPDGGTTTTQGIGCNSYVACLTDATTEAEAHACDGLASTRATGILDAIDICVLSFCEGNTGGSARCRTDGDGNPTNLDGAPAFDDTGEPTGDCGDCLDNGEAALWNEACEPADDPACNTSACAQQTEACRADM